MINDITKVQESIEPTQTKRVIVGLDLSVNCTGICVRTIDLATKDYTFELATVTPGHVDYAGSATSLTFKKENQKTVFEKSISSTNSAQQIILFLEKFEQIDEIRIESMVFSPYAFGKKSRTMDLAVHAVSVYTVLVHAGFRDKIRFCAAARLKARFIKKNATKDEMCAKFHRLYPGMLDASKYKIDDMVDAFALTHIDIV